MATEHLRPRFHATPSRNWMNDPNGLIHHGGRWHVFFQHNPEGNDWGNMSWGHLSSTDLVHWDEHPVAIRHREGEEIYSGSVVADGERLVAVHTSAYADGRQAQSLATSTDGGETWTAYAGNPVLDRGRTDFRDPKVFRHGDRWVMVAVDAEDCRVVVCDSEDLVTWRHLSDLEDPREEDRIWECPDLFPLATPAGGTAWVLLISVHGGMRYLVGDFDGTAFAPYDRELRWVDHGPDCYAGVTFNDAPDGRRVMIAWLSNWDYAGDVPTDPWRGQMTVPRELSLVEHDGALVLAQRPVAEVTAYVGSVSVGTQEVDVLLDTMSVEAFSRDGRVAMTHLRWPTDSSPATSAADRTSPNVR